MRRERRPGFPGSHQRYHDRSAMQNATQHVKIADELSFANNRIVRGNGFREEAGLGGGSLSG